MPNPNAVPQYVNLLYRCEDCGKEQRFFGRAKEAERDFAAFIQKHASCIQRTPLGYYHGTYDHTQRCTAGACND